MEISVPEAITFIENNIKYAEHADLKRLAKLLGVDFNPDKGKNTPRKPINMQDEVQAQMEIVQTLRERVMVSTNPRDLTALVDTTTRLVTLVTKLGSEIDNQEKVKRLERALVETMQQLPPESQDFYYEKLTESLSD